MVYDELIKRMRDSKHEIDCSLCDRDCCYQDGKVHGKCIIIEAADAIEELKMTADSYKRSMEAWADEAANVQPRWVSVTERLPENGVHVLLSCKCGSGAYVCDGFHTEKYSTPTQFYEDIDADYDEDTDEYYFPEGWWEVVKNWDDYSCVAIEDTVTHWMPLPEPPKEET